MIIDGWRPIISSTVRRAPCIRCSEVSSWHPKGWFYRHVPKLGGTRHDPKVSTERLCPTCAEKELGAVRVAELLGGGRL